VVGLGAMPPSRSYSGPCSGLCSQPGLGPWPERPHPTLERGASWRRRCSRLLRCGCRRVRRYRGAGERRPGSVRGRAGVRSVAAQARARVLALVWVGCAWSCHLLASCCPAALRRAALRCCAVLSCVCVWQPRLVAGADCAEGLDGAAVPGAMRLVWCPFAVCRGVVGAPEGMAASGSGTGGVVSPWTRAGHDRARSCTAWSGFAVHAGGSSCGRSRLRVRHCLLVGVIPTRKSSTQSRPIGGADSCGPIALG
jgi:hypothetical protein